MTDKNTPLTLAFEDRFPIAEKKSELIFSNDQISDLNQSAADVLGSIIALEQMSYEHIDLDKKGKSSDIQRLEQKVDFITELLVKVIQSQQKIPLKKAIKMSAEKVFWTPEIILIPGDYCLLSVHLSQKYPTPLELPVEVLTSNIEGSGEVIVEARVMLSDENVIEDLTRMIFLYHRRQIARDKAQS